MMSIEGPTSSHSVSNDWEMKIPDWALHFGPLLLAVFCLGISLADYSVFIGFEEQEPGTYLSLTMMFTVFVLSLAAMRNGQLHRSTRLVAAITSVISALAMFDETHKWHERVGEFVQENFRFLPRRLTHYTDDVIILLGAIVGGVILYFSLRLVARESDLRPYLVAVVALALAHGLLDIVSHRDYMLKMFWPDLPKQAARALVDQLSCFEEWCKIWCGWFVILFLQRLFHGQRTPLLWSAQIFLGSVLATVGLWAVPDVTQGIPYLTIGEPHHFLRNFQALFQLAFVWLTWVGITWLCFGRDETKRNLAGLLYLAPLAMWVGTLPAAETMGPAIEWLIDSLIPNPYFGSAILRHSMLLFLLLIPGLALGLGAGFLLRRHPRLLAVGQVTPLFFTLLFSEAFQFQGWGGGTAPLILVLGVGLLAVPRTWLVAGGLILIGLASAHSPLFLCVVFPVIVVSFFQTIPGRTPQGGTVYWRRLATTHLAFAVAVAWLASSTLLPKHKYRDRNAPFFRIRYQPLVKESRR